MRKRRTCYLLRCWSELFCSLARASPAYIRSANGRECSRARSGLVLSARSSLVLPAANQNASLRQVVVVHQEHKRAREQKGEYLERAMCIFQIFKVDSWLAFFGHAKIFSCSPLSLAPAAAFPLFVACTLPAIPVKFPSRTSRNLSEKNPKFDTLSQNAGGWDEDEDEEENNALSRKRSLLLDSKVLARPISLRRH